MNVIATKGKALPQYTLYYDADKNLADLPLSVQQCLEAMGEVTFQRTRDLTGCMDTHSRTVVEAIRTKGAYLEKTSVDITVSIVPVGGDPGQQR